MAVIALDRGHVGRNYGNVTKAGAQSGSLNEDVLAREYMRAIEDTLRAAGHEVILLCHGTYSSRQAFASPIADVFVACHVNAGGGTYGLVCYDHRSKSGPVLAQTVANELQRAWGSTPENPLSKTVAAAASSEKWENAWNLIKGVYSGKPVGLVFEPFFLDQKHHACMATPEGLARTGKALADGIIAWLAGRT